MPPRNEFDSEDGSIAAVTSQRGTKYKPVLLLQDGVCGTDEAGWSC
jgi:hypothetical protein